MGYSREVYEEAMKILEQRRTESAAKAAALRERMLAYSPRVAELEREIRQAASQVAQAILSGGNIQEEIENIKNRNLALQAELAELLKQAGETATNFEPQPTCSLCNDTGYRGQDMCQCLKQLLREIACRQVSKIGDVQAPLFSDLRLDYYSDKPDKNGCSPRERMRHILTYCKNYAEDFSRHSVSLLMLGPVGVGKTYFSLAIARSAAERGFHVIYGPVQMLLHQLESEYFGRSEGDSQELMTSCDLLILDDLGSEFVSPFYTSCLYHLINTRLMASLPTIISTNLSPKQLAERYGEQIASRITGCFQPLVFEGKDIRQLKLKERIQKQ